MTDRDTDVWPDNRKELLAWFVFAAALVGLSVWFLHPGLLDRGTPRDVGPPEGVEAPEDGLAIGVEDRDYLNRIFAEQTTEVVYCGVLEDRVLGVALATMVESSAKAASYRREDCPPSPDGPVNVHTHPGRIEGLSATDVALLREHGYRYVCVQTDTIAARVGERTRALSCYGLGEDGEPHDVPVSVAAG